MIRCTLEYVKSTLSFLFIVRFFGIPDAFAYENRVFAQLNPVLVYYFHVNASSSFTCLERFEFPIPKASMTPNQP